mmetsp:Transcript_37244/g.6657  ORF Transcript_37244/g.6657 Transcript_37244/m.6657 type:complete len:81 (+) Transcript_37244:1569-1811(+)
MTIPANNATKHAKHALDLFQTNAYLASLSSSLNAWITLKTTAVSRHNAYVLMALTLMILKIHASLAMFPVRNARMILIIA